MWRIREAGDVVDLNLKQQRDATVTIYPEEGNFASIAKALLAVADHPDQVRSVSHPKAGLEVPEDVFDRFEAAQGSGEPIVTAPASRQELPQTLKRRSGRPRKTPEPENPPADASKEE